MGSKIYEVNERKSRVKIGWTWLVLLFRFHTIKRRGGEEGKGIHDRDSSELLTS
jgi:hypothetical protein